MVTCCQPVIGAHRNALCGRLEPISPTFILFLTRVIIRDITAWHTASPTKIRTQHSRVGLGHETDWAYMTKEILWTGNSPSFVSSNCAREGDAKRDVKIRWKHVSFQARETASAFSAEFYSIKQPARCMQTRGSNWLLVRCSYRWQRRKQDCKT
jgi:hypothetical protein